MDFRYPPFSRPSRSWITANVPENRTTGYVNYSITQPPPTQGPSTVSQDSFSFSPNPVGQYLYSGSTTSDTLLQTQEMESFDLIQQYLTFSPPEPYPALPDFVAPGYNSQGFITEREFSSSLGGPNAPSADATPLTGTQEPYGRYTMSTIPFSNPPGDSRPTSTSWSPEVLMGMSLTRVSPPQVPIRQGIAPTLTVRNPSVQDKLMNYVSPPEAPTPRAGARSADARRTRAVGRTRKSHSKRVFKRNPADEEQLSPNLKREALGLRSLRRRVAPYPVSGTAKFKSPIVPPSKEEGSYSNLIDSIMSDGESNGDSDDQSYHPSPTSSPSIDQSGPSSYRKSFGCTAHRRESSNTTVDESMGSPFASAPITGKGSKGTTGSRRNSKGKAKGSAALSLAKLKMKYNKPLTGPFGTYSPLPCESGEGSNATCSDLGGIRPGKSRRNGHIPPPVVVPNLMKKSRGRKVPTRFEKDAVPRPFVCPLCSAAFTRVEHRKRHLRSIHTNMAGALYSCSL